MTVYFSEGAALLRWTEPEWLAAAHAWIDDRLDELQVGRTGDIVQVYVRSWSTVMRVPTDGGLLFFKASGPEQAVEVPLVNALATFTNDVVAPLASDDALGWMLMRDGGARLRELPANTELETWLAIVRKYAHLQLTVVGHVDELLAIGVRDFRLEALPARFADLLADEELVVRELTAYEQARLAEWDLAGLCSELAAYGIPQTIEHNDLHAGNVFFSNGHAFFFDWGDASISHPFHTMWTTLRVFARTMDVASDDPLVLELRDAYLEAFGDVSSLLRPFELAQTTVIVSKALTFAPFVRAMPPLFRARYGRTVADVLRWLLDE